LGFTISLTIIGAIRELLGSGAIFGHQIIAGKELLIFILPPGGFIVIGFLIAAARFFQTVNRNRRDNIKL